MANVNKVILIGRLTRDPKTRTFGNGGKVVQFGFAVTSKKKNQQTGQWDDHPMFIDCKAFKNSEFNMTADLIEQNLRKGQQVYLDGKLEFEQWDDKTTGQKRSKHVLIVDNMQYLEPRQDGGGAPARSYGSGSAPAARPAAANYYPADDDGPPSSGGGSSGADEDIPF